MHRDETKLRSGLPTLEEGREFARYLDTAAEGFFGLLLGPRAEEILATVYTEPEHDLSFQNVTFAEREGIIVGMVSGYTAEQHRRSSDRLVKRAAGRWNLRFRIVSLLLAPFFRIIDTIDDGDFYLQAIAVDGQARGAGIGGLLMDSIENRAAATRSRRLVLDVAAENGTARRFYERRGMTIASRWPERWAVPKLKMLRMAKALGR